MLLLTSIFEPGLPLRQLRGRLRFFDHQHWLAYASGLGIIWVTSTFVIPKKDDLMSGTRHSPMVRRERLPRSIFPHVLETCQPHYTRRDSSSLGIIRTLSRIDHIFFSIYLWPRRVIFTATSMSLKTWGIGPF